MPSKEKKKKKPGNSVVGGRWGEERERGCGAAGNREEECAGVYGCKAQGVDNSIKLTETPTAHQGNEDEVNHQLERVVQGPWIGVCVSARMP